ncbi:quinone oxidoreductase family protein [Methylobrevis pamukkalensis]|uniref:Quinone oxidoreductase 1 n=1 Tax=Methylobrevis pamukkalensis TaxID=1439726 RepID=A0A1E3H7L5_9HYPH|nr:zinc-binding alcohol dehydrogenase family protein [Methylobrevis pamukkalensis]ODN72312.1 Quinone oxidoreductase 1 [Methylobrevis pamukkalensis]
MKAAVLSAPGIPDYASFEAPVAREGESLVTVTAAGLNPIDVLLASGRIGPPMLPSVPGREGVGTVDGRRVYFSASRAPFGSMAEMSLAATGALMPLLDDIDDGTALALGIAGLTGWLALSESARLVAGETVLVLGASGAVGVVALQAARLLGAGRVVAAARSAEGQARALELGADAVVDLSSEDNLAGRIREACAGRLDVVVDPLWGPPAKAALSCLTAGGRLIQIGNSAGAELVLNPAFMRFPRSAILGFSGGSVAHGPRAAAFARMQDHVLAGELATTFTAMPLSDVASAFELQMRSPGSKLVLVP